jgi:hypothetical protein
MIETQEKTDVNELPKKTVVVELAGHFNKG